LFLKEQWAIGHQSYHSKNHLKFLPLRLTLYPRNHNTVKDKILELLPLPGHTLQ
jgi:hypothetical protein